MEANLTRTISKYPAEAGYFFCPQLKTSTIVLIVFARRSPQHGCKKKLFLCFLLLTLFAMIAIYISIETRKG